MPLSSEEWVRLAVLTQEIYRTTDKTVIAYLTQEIEKLETKKAQSPTAS